MARGRKIAWEASASMRVSDEELPGRVLLKFRAVASSSSSFSPGWMNAMRFSCGMNEAAVLQLVHFIFQLIFIKFKYNPLYCAFFSTANNEILVRVLFEEQQQQNESKKSRKKRWTTAKYSTDGQETCARKVPKIDNTRGRTSSKTKAYA